MKLCNKDCNNCPIVNHENSRMITFVLNSLLKQAGEHIVYPIVQNACPNLTCCFDCAIDDFGHFDDCEIMKEVEKFGLERNAIVLNYELLRVEGEEEEKRPFVYLADLLEILNKRLPEMVSAEIWEDVERLNRR